VIFVWGRDIDNLEAPYLASELSLLTTWELIKPTLGEETKASSDIVVVLNELIQVHMSIASTLLSKLLPFVTIPDGLSSAVMSPTSVDANLKLFDILGRIAIHGLWLKWHGEAIANDQPATSAFHEQALKQIQALCGNGFDAIRNNGCLRLPIADHVATDVALFLLLWLASESDEGELRPWLTSLVERLEFTLATRGRYPTSFDDYRDLIEHPRDSGDEYFRKATAGSTLIPLVAAWLTGLGESELVARISTLVGDKLKHCTIQLWTPDTSSEEHMYVNSENHGRAITDIPIDKSGTELLRTISDACGGDAGFNSLTAAKYGFWPLVMVACRHWRFPIPPDFWIGALQSGRPEESSGANAPNPESPEL
jgi:hypothetical protein